MPTSMEMARHLVVSSFNAFPTPYPSRYPHTLCKMTTATINNPEVKILAELAATTAATMATMAVVEISGRISTTASVSFLKK